MPKTSFQVAFQMEIQGDAAAADPDAPPLEDLAQDVVGAVAASDAARCIRAGRRLYALHELKPQTAYGLIRALLDIGRPDEALQLLRDKGLGLDPRTAGHALFRAEALAGIDMFDKAAPALEKAVALGLEGPAAARAEALRGLIARRPGLGATSLWIEFEAFIDACLDFKLARPAVAVWREALALAAGPLSDALDDILAAAPAMLRMADPALVDDILRDLQGALPRKHDRRALAATSKTLRALARGTDAPTRETERVLPLTQFMAAEAYAAAGEWRRAIAALGAVDRVKVISPVNPDLTGSVRTELARCVGREVIREHPLTFAPPGPPKVFDLFAFNGEFDMLDLKLAEMGPWVDHFVIVEAGTTFTGLPKPLHFEERRGDYHSHADRITYVVVDGFPDHLTSAWAREFYQKDSAVAGLSGRLAPDDLVLISDADEIVDRSVLGKFRGPAQGMSMRTFQHFFNNEIVPARGAVISVIASARLLRFNGISYLRCGVKQYARKARLRAGGWHFTSITDPEGLEAKMKSYSHQEHAHLDRHYFSEFMATIRAGAVPGFARREIDDSFPAYLRENREALKRFIL